MVEKPVCGKCGDRGWPETLVRCYMCQDAFEHRYCFDKASDIFSEIVKWACQDCLPTIPKKSKIKENDVITPTRRSKRISLKQDLDADTSPSSKASEKGSSLETDKKRERKRKAFEVSQTKDPLGSPVKDSLVQKNCSISEVEKSSSLETHKKRKKKRRASEVSEKVKPLESPDKVSHGDKKDCSTSEAELGSSLKTDKKDCSTSEAEMGSSLKTDKKRKKKACELSQKEEPSGSPVKILHGSHEQKDCSASEVDKVSSLKTNNKRKKKRKVSQEEGSSVKEPSASPVKEPSGSPVKILDGNHEQKDCSTSEAEKVSSLKTNKKRKKKRKVCEVSQNEGSPVKVLHDEFEQKDCSTSEAEKVFSLKTNKKRKKKRKACEVSQKEGSPVQVLHEQKDCSTSEADKISSLKTNKRRKKKRKVSEESQKEGSPVKVLHDELQQKDCSTSEAENVPPEEKKKSLSGEECSIDFLVIDDLFEDLQRSYVQALPAASSSSRNAEKVSPVEANIKRKKKLRRCKVGRKEKSVKTASYVCHGELELNDCSTPAEEKLPSSEMRMESLSMATFTIDPPLQDAANDDISNIVDPSHAPPMEVPIIYVEPQPIAHLMAASYVELQPIAHQIKVEISHVEPQPGMDPIWIGTFSICNDRFTKVDGVVAYLSSRACLRVREEASSLPYFLYPDILPRSDIWPKSFQKCELNENCIALYFLPDNRDEQVFSSLVNHLNRGDLGMKCMVENAELLIFSSVLLPLELRDFHAEDFLWGVFKRKKGSGTG